MFAAGLTVITQDHHGSDCKTLGEDNPGLGTPNSWFVYSFAAGSFGLRVEEGGLGRGLLSW